ncbi:MAG TPA: DUF4835 family protein [Bacteroidota bacterium]|nr:DUF4835 family protein [Bacteroidota bacterium]
MRSIAVVVIIAALLSIPYTVSAQIDCQVTVNMDKIQGTNKEYLQNFAQDIQTYISSNKWAADDYDGEKIKCTLNIFFLSQTGDNSYSAQIFLGSQRPIYKDPSAKFTAMVRIVDDRWEFAYSKDRPLYRNEQQFDALTDFIDFYMYLVVGFDYDSYEPSGGTKYFQKAFVFCNQASSSAKGWDRNPSGYSRLGLVEDLLNPKYQPFREGFYLYHYKGLDWFAKKPAEAYKNIISVLQNIAEQKKSGNPRALIFKNFFDAKFMELADIFKNYESSKSVYSLLISIDQAHQSTYEEAARKAK